MIRPVSGPILMNIFKYGFWLDLSMSSYLTLLMFFLFLLSRLIQHKAWIYTIHFISGISLLLLTILACADAVVYKHWSAKINPMAISFLSSPKEVMASVGHDDHILVISIVGVLTFYVLYKLYFILSRFLFKDQVKNKVELMVGSLILFPLLVIGIRGGLQLEPINQSSAFFSDRTIYNHAALNTSWNLLNKYTLKKKDHSIYGASSESKLDSAVLAFYHKKPNEWIIKNHQKPNILFIILEGISADAIAAFGGSKGYTPYLDSVMQRSLIWTNFYANGDRTYKGLPAILNGWPTRPVGSITQDADHTGDLPSLAKILKSNGYSTSFYYGGESEFANIKSYLLNTGFNQIVDINDFSNTLRGKKWGVADHYVFEKLARDLNETKRPFFNTILTLSSHEPYDIPLKAFVEGKDPREMYLNTVMYTDYSLGRFFSSIKNYAWFDSTLFVITADHGNYLPANYMTNYEPGRFKIPMILYGNLIPDSLKGSRNTNVSSQNDIAYSILRLLDFEDTGFRYAQNMFASAGGSAFYTFDHGFGLINTESKICYDYNSNKIIFQEGNQKDSLLSLGKLIMEATQKK